MKRVQGAEKDRRSVTVHWIEVHERHVFQYFNVARTHFGAKIKDLSPRSRCDKGIVLEQWQLTLEQCLWEGTTAPHVWDTDVSTEQSLWFESIYKPDSFSSSPPSSSHRPHRTLYTTVLT